MNRLIERVKLLFAQWLSGRHGREAGDVLLDRHRVYILPTAPGLVFAAAMFVMLIGSINYGLQLGFLLTFLVASMAVVGMYHTHRNLARITVRGHDAAPVFAGDMAAFEFWIGNPTAEARFALNFAFLLPIRRGEGSLSRSRERPTSGTTIDLPAASTMQVHVALGTRRRGMRPCPRLRISTRFPLGLWRAWSYVTPPLTAVVYPAPEIDAPNLPGGAGGHEDDVGQATVDGDDFAGVRPYRAGDPQKAIAWRLAARSDELSIKLFDSTVGGDLMLDFQALAPMDRESRLARLTRWILMAEAAQMRYGISLPDQRIDLGRGPEHRHRCLAALAAQPMD